MRKSFAVLAAVFAIGPAFLLAVPVARAQTDSADEDPDLIEEEERDQIRAANAEAAGKSTKPTVAEAARAPLEAVVRGFFLEMKVGGGYMLVDQPMPASFTDRFPAGSEGLGPGAAVALTAGYDITDMIAIQLVGGAAMVGGNRGDFVRDLGLIFIGAQARVAIDLTDRLDFLAAGGVAFVSADNAVEPATLGIGILVNAGLEYYVHVRHFSIGIDLGMYLPVTPVRMFLVLSPTIKYTF